METLPSSSLTTFQVPKPSKPNHNHLTHIKPPLSHHHHHPSSVAKSTATSSFSTLQQKDTFTPLNFHHPKYPSSTFIPPPNRSSSPSRAYVNRRAASGYAAALLDVSQCNGTVLKVERDVRRLLKVWEFMMNNDLVQESDKGKVVKELLEKGKFEKNFVGLVKLVVDKGKKVEFVKEVLEEFLRVFSQLYVNLSPPMLAKGNP